MPITVEEKIQSPRGAVGDRGRITLDYVARGTNDYAAIRTAVLSTAPAGYQGLVRSDPEITPEGSAETGVWSVSVPYVPLQFSPRDTEGFQFYRGRTVGGTKRTDYGLAVKNTYVAPGSFGTIDFGAALYCSREANGQIKVNGADIVAPVFEFEIGWVFPNSSVTAAYLGTVYAMTGKTNTATFYGCGIGDCLFLGAEFDKKGTGKWEFTFRFRANPGTTNAAVGDITNVAAGGWDIAWGYTVPEESTSAKVLAPFVRQVNVVQVYGSSDFSGLAIGSNWPSGSIG